MSIVTTPCWVSKEDVLTYFALHLTKNVLLGFERVKSTPVFQDKIKIRELGHVRNFLAWQCVIPPPHFPRNEL